MFTRRWGWTVTGIAILLILSLIAALEAGSAVTPPPQVAALDAALLQAATPLVTYSVIPSPAHTPEPIATETPAATYTPTSTPLPVAATLTIVRPTPEPTEPLPRHLPTLPRPTATLAFARPITVPASMPAPDAVQRAAQVPILMYHYISDPPPGSDSLRYGLSVTPANFDAQLGYLKQAGYRAITLYDLHDFLTQGKPLPDKPIILTFDDGYVDAYTHALPILQQHGLVGTFFVLTGPADRDGEGRYLTYKQMAAMSAAGMDIELHSREHYDLRSRSNDFLVHQIAGGKESLEAHLNRPVRWFAYPSGQYDAAVVRVLKSAGFWGSVTTQPGRAHTPATLFDLPRIRIGGAHTLNAFIKTLASP